MRSLYGGKEPYTFVTSPEKQSISGVEGAARGRGGAQVLEHWGPECAENINSPVRPRVPARVLTFQISGLGGGERFGSRSGSGRFAATVRFGSWRFGFCGSVRFQNLTERKNFATAVDENPNRSHSPAWPAHLPVLSRSSIAFLPTLFRFCERIEWGCRQSQAKEVEQLRSN